MVSFYFSIEISKEIIIRWKSNKKNLFFCSRKENVNTVASFSFQDGMIIMSYFLSLFSMLLYSTNKRKIAFSCFFTNTLQCSGCTLVENIRISHESQPSSLQGGVFFLFRSVSITAKKHDVLFRLPICAVSHAYAP